MQIEVGKFYRTRDGRKAGPIEKNRNANTELDNEFIAPDFDGVWESSWFSDGRFLPIIEHDMDLISEWSDAPTGPVRTVTRTVTEVVPGVYGAVEITHVDSLENVCIRIDSGFSAKGIGKLIDTLSTIKAGMEATDEAN